MKIDEIKWGKLVDEGRKRELYKVGMTKDELRKALKEAVGGDTIDMKIKPEKMEKGEVSNDGTNPMEVEETEDSDTEDEPEKESKEEESEEESSWVGGHTLEKGE